MAITIKSSFRPPGFDTRGLPDDYDPHKFYEYRYDTLVTTATGVESFAYKYIPKSIMQSIAFAIDPLAPFKVASHRITPENRTRKRSTASVLQMRSLTNHQYSFSHSQRPNFGGISVCCHQLLTRLLPLILQAMLLLPRNRLWLILSSTLLLALGLWEANKER